MEKLVILNEEQVVKFRDNLKEMVISGEIEPLKFQKQIALLGKVVESLSKDPEIEEAILNNAALYHTDELKGLYGCEFQVKEVGTKYDYTQTNDTDLFELENQKKEIDAKIKARQKVLQNLNGEMYNSEGVQLSKALKSSKTKVVCITKIKL